MPPRYAYWTILIDNKPTAFRAREKDELLPTFNQLRRTNKDVVFKWFARGRLWESPMDQQAAQRRPKVVGEKRGRDWRPGGQHKDPRARFKKGGKRRADRPRQPSDVVQAFRPADNQTFRPAGDDAFRPAGRDRDRNAPRESRPWRNQKHGKGHKTFRPRNDPPRRDIPPERREAEPPARPSRESTPESPAPPEQTVIKPEPPERG